MLTTKFQTVITEYGVGIKATTEFLLRVEIDNNIGKKFLGIGLSLDALSARLASEGEAIERSTWRYGALWNSATLCYDNMFLPEDTTLLFSKEEQNNMTRSPSLVYRGKSSNGELLSIPSEALFFYPRRKQFGSHHSTTTGWAFHTTQSEALAQGYREVIERDLQMLFWHNRLDKYLEIIPKNKTQKWLKAYGQTPNKDSELYLLQMPIGLHPSIHANGYFTLAIQVRKKIPYLSIGSAVKESAHGSFQTAIGEMIMLNSHQYDMVLTDIKYDDEFSYNTHVTQATYEKTARDRVQEIIFTLLKRKEKLKLDYSKHNYQVVYLDPPPKTVKGVVAKVWVDKTHGMLPAGFKEYRVSNHWKEKWNMSQTEWQENAWHPYP